MSYRVSPLQPGVRLTAIFDSCHSGSALDLPYIYSTQGVLKEPNLAKEAGQGLLGIVSSYARGDIGGMLSTAQGIFKKATTGDDTYKRNMRTKTSPADVVMWSGSKDSQTSYVDPLFPDEPDLFFDEPAIMVMEDLTTSPYHALMCFSFSTALAAFAAFKRLFSAMTVSTATFSTSPRLGSPWWADLGVGTTSCVGSVVAEQHSKLTSQRPLANTFSRQTRREYRWPGHRSHVLGFRHSSEEEPATELCVAAQQYSPGA